MTLDAKKHGKVPELAWIPVARCDVDRRYQRSMDGKRSQALIDRLVDKWHWARCGCLLATRAPNDRFWLQDGQHRSAAAARLGITHLPALVSDDMSVEDQAAAFVGANLDRVALNQFALHHARTIAGDADALAIAEACREAGIRIPRYQPKPKEMKPGDTLAIGTIASLFKKHPREIVRLTLATVADALRGGAGMLRGQVFTAVAALLTAAPEAERDDLARRIKASLTARAWSAIWTEVATRRAAGVAGAAAMEQVLREGLAPAPQRPAMPPPGCSASAGATPDTRAAYRAAASRSGSARESVAAVEAGARGRCRHSRAHRRQGRDAGRYRRGAGRRHCDERGAPLRRRHRGGGRQVQGLPARRQPHNRPRAVAGARQPLPARARLAGLARSGRALGAATAAGAARLEARRAATADARQGRGVSHG